ncbi:MAG: insulinase family protein [Deltaproteobacteria bacterium]|nr:MAG: insulinase family protein [Deltaproteobacteria bacterium]
MDPVHKSVLDNGLRVVTVELPHLHTAMIAAYVRAGSRHEDPARNGVSHFLEHLFFRGSEGFPDGRSMNALVEDCGGSLNGVTTRDHGYYFSPVHPRKLEVPFAVLGDMLARPLFKEIELEREVILEEILDEVDEKGRDIDVDNLSKRALFGAHPLAMKIAGSAETVQGLREEDLRRHHARAYGARNLVLCCAGPIKHAEVLRFAEKSFARLAPGAPLHDTPLDGLAGGGPQLVAVEHVESQVELQVSFRGPPEEHKDFPALRVIKRILDDGLASRLQLNLVERKALAYSVGAGMDGFSDCSVFEAGCACAPRKASSALQEILRILGELRDEDVPEDELSRAKRKTRIWLEFSLDSPAEMIGWFGGGELLHPPAESFETWIGRIEAVTAEDVRRVAANTFRRDALVAVAVGPVGSVEKKLRAAVEGGL